MVAYKQIKGVKYHKALLERASEMVTGQGDGRISKEDAAKLWEEATNGGSVGACERRTIQYILDNYNCTDAGRRLIEARLSGKDGDDEPGAMEVDGDPNPAELAAAATAIEQEAREPVFIDALPYIDSEYTEMGGMRQHVEKMIRQEMARFQPKSTEEYLKSVGLPALDTLSLKVLQQPLLLRGVNCVWQDAPMAAAELLRIKNGKDMEQLDTTR